MLGLMLVLLTTAADAKVTIVERSTLGLSPAAGALLRERLKLAFEKVGLEVALATEGCADRLCLLAVAHTQKSCAVGVTVVKSRKGLTVDLEAVDAEHVLLQQTFLLSSEKLETSPEAQVFAYQLSAKLVKDRPVVEAPVPEPRSVAVEVETKPEWLEPAPAPMGPRVLGISSAAVGAAGLALIVVSAVVKGQLDTALAEQPVITSLTRGQAQQQADLSNALLGTGVVALGLGLAGGTTALVLGSQPGD